jgi:hypothetical protein
LWEKLFAGGEKKQYGWLEVSINLQTTFIWNNDGSRYFREPAGEKSQEVDGVFTALGFSFNVQFTDETAACMIVSGDIYVMLLTHEKFKTFTPNKISDAKKTRRCLSACRRRAGQKSTRWFATRSPAAE